MSLNVPDTRRIELARRLRSGEQIVAAEIAQEFNVSIDTIRRDILALEADGKAQRVRGGAVPLAIPSDPIDQRLSGGQRPSPCLIQAAIREIGDALTLLVDGGTTTLSVIEHLPNRDGLLVITPSPWIAIAGQKKGISIFLLGGSLRPQGGIATGATALDRAADVAADVAILGACGLDVDFGLSSDDAEEAQMKRAMHHAANRTIVVADHKKFGRRARHHTLPLSDVAAVITDTRTAATDVIAAETRVLTK